MTHNRDSKLIGKRLAGEMTPEELKEFDHLIAGDDSFRREYELLKRYWKEKEEPYAGADKLLSAIKKRATIDETEATNSAIPKKGRSLWILRVAAVVTLFSVATIAYILLSQRIQPQDIAWKLLRTPAKLTSSVTLPDGTRIMLNSETVLKYQANFTAKNREIWLTGEAFFHVAADTARPFIVHTEKFDITVLGTSFNVKTYPNDPVEETTLIEGSIALTLKSSGDTRLTLKPGDKLLLNDKGYQLGSQTSYGNENGTIMETAWMNHKLIFKDQPFDLLANSLSRKYGVSFIFKNEKLKTALFSGEYEKEDLMQVLRSLQLITPFQYTIRNNSVLIY